MEYRADWGCQIWEPGPDVPCLSPPRAGGECGTDGEGNQYLPCPSAYVTVGFITGNIPHLSVIVRRVLGLGRADGQGGSVP